MERTADATRMHMATDSHLRKVGLPFSVAMELDLQAVIDLHLDAWLRGA